MKHVQRNIKFKDRVQVLEFKKKQFVTNLLKGAKKDIPDCDVSLHLCEMFV